MPRGQARADRRRQRDQSAHARAADAHLEHGVRRGRVRRRGARTVRCRRALRRRPARLADGRRWTASSSPASCTRRQPEPAAHHDQLRRPAGAARARRRGVRRLPQQAGQAVAAPPRARGALGRPERRRRGRTAGLGVRRRPRPAPAAAHSPRRGQHDQPGARGAVPAAHGLRVRRREQRPRGGGGRRTAAPTTSC